MRAVFVTIHADASAALAADLARRGVAMMDEVGHAAGAPLLATALHRQLLTAGVAGGCGERDNSAIIAVLRRIAREAHVLAKETA